MNQIDRNVKESPNKQTGIPITIPENIFKWLIYSALFSGPLASWYPQLVGWDGLIGSCLILGHFASQLNAVINKK